MEQRLITLKNGQIKAIYEYFAELMKQDGKNAAFSYMIYKNTITLSEHYNQITSQIYDESADSEFKAFIAKANELTAKYADRNEQGEYILNDQGQPMITEQIAEFKEASEKLAEENKAVIDARNEKVKNSIAVLDTQVELNLLVTQIENFPNETPPAIVGIFGI